VVDKASKEAYTQGKCDMLSELTSSDATIQAAVEKAVAVTVERCLSIIDNAIACYDETEGAQRQALKICADHVRGLLPDHNYSERKLPDLRVDHEDVMFFTKEI